MIKIYQAARNDVCLIVDSFRVRFDENLSLLYPFKEPGLEFYCSKKRGEYRCYCASQPFDARGETFLDAFWTWTRAFDARFSTFVRLNWREKGDWVSRRYGDVGGEKLFKRIFCDRLWERFDLAKYLRVNPRLVNKSGFMARLEENGWGESTTTVRWEDGSESLLDGAKEWRALEKLRLGDSFYCLAKESFATGETTGIVKLLSVRSLDGRESTL